MTVGSNRMDPFAVPDEASSLMSVQSPVRRTIQKRVDASTSSVL